MVNRGASHGCITCRQRRVKCDESKPYCQNCLRVGRQCAGYGKKPVQVRFRDKNARYAPERQTDSSTHVKNSDGDRKEARKHTRGACPAQRRAVSSDSTRELVDQRNPAPGDTITIPQNPQPRQHDLAVPFFLTYITHVGRSLQSTRGFLELIGPILATENCSSALSAAVSVAAVRVWRRLRPDSITASQTIQVHHRALVRIQKAIDEPSERVRDGTVLAVLVLQLHDTFAAICDGHTAHGVHRDGAWALLAQDRTFGAKSALHRGSMLGHVFHSRISFCIRQKISMAESFVNWLHFQVIPGLPLTPSSLLDIIGISVIELQHTVDTLFAASESGILAQKLEKATHLVMSVKYQLKMWLEALPRSWHPRRLRRGVDFDVSVDAYQGVCDIYPGIQIANIWNQWRIYALVLEKSKLQLTKDLLSLHWRALPTTHTEQICGDSVACRNHEIPMLVNSISYSVPFYLGDMACPLTYHDIETPQIIFPSFHNLDPKDQAFLEYSSSDHYASPVDHRRYIMLQGPLHIMSVLTHLISLFAGEQASMASHTLQQEQKEWIQKQYMRSLRVTGIIPNAFADENTPYSHGSFCQNHGNKVAQTEALASRVRQSLWTMNIL